MIRFLTRRLSLTLLAVWGALSAVFLVLHSSGDPAVMMAPIGAPPEKVAQLSHALGYDRPLAEQYFSFFGDALRGHFPDSLTFQQPAIEVVLQRLGATVLLAGVALAAAALLALAVGLWTGSREGGGARREWPMWVVFLAQSVPGFYIGVLLVWIFGVRLHWLPTSGATTATSIVLPAATLACGVLPPLARVFRNNLRGELARPYSRTGTALGMSRARVVRHAAYGSLLPTVTVLGLEAGALLGGTVIVESVFSWPGVGQLAVTALQNQDYPLVLADLTFLILAFVLVNLIVDLLYGVLDPRVRHEGRGPR
ncbi:oligopeptide ABC transporter permease protein [Streptomyces bingchenggensis BCW-1]|uniref:Oligopeptide ABC transporter permease protein n=1 Tax=Streptomyces bingchenggensis (strain BCW-1) TaxID=749414 RepID=D7BY28_STRBB|nr:MULTISPECIES: ABC transporter permease [Streptomyces]ADI11908.1 oligopeptide ABC transporter permease protein [Streptomyces bingchenggensis BCW-1]